MYTKEKQTKTKKKLIVFAVSIIRLPPRKSALYRCAQSLSKKN